MQGSTCSLRHSPTICADVHHSYGRWLGFGGELSGGSCGLQAITWILFLKKNEDPDWAPKLGGVSHRVRVTLSKSCPSKESRDGAQVVLSPLQRWLLLAASPAVQQCSSAAVQQCGRLYWALAFQSVAAISEAAITTIVLLLWVGGVIFNAVRTLYFMFIDTRSHGM